jgi:U3 small nucleolar RNA-associated protein 13
VALRDNDNDLFVAFENLQIQQWSLTSEDELDDDDDNDNNNNNDEDDADGGAKSLAGTKKRRAPEETNGEQSSGAVLVRAWKQHDAPIRTMTFDGSGTLLATSGADRCVMVYDVERRHVTHALHGHKQVVTCLTFHPDPSQHTLLSGDEGGALIRWNLRSKRGQALEAHASAVTAVVVCSDGRRAVSVGRDSVLCVWDLAAALLLRTLPTSERLEGLVVLPSLRAAPRSSSDAKRRRKAASTTKPSSTTATTSDTLVASVGERGVVRVWCVEAGRERSDVVADGGGLGQYTSIAVATRRSTLLATTADNTIVLLTPDNSNDDDCDSLLTPSRVVVGDNDSVTDICFRTFGLRAAAYALPQLTLCCVLCLVDGGRLAVSCNSDLVRVVKIDTVECTLLAGHTDIVMGVAVSGDGRRLAT